MSTKDSQPVAVKIQNEDKTKRLREQPESFNALKNQVEALLALPKTSSSESKPFRITYKDNDNDEVNVSDDDDLLMAYDIAKLDFNNQIKFSVKRNEAANSKKFNQDLEDVPMTARAVSNKFDREDLEEEKMPNTARNHYEVDDLAQEFQKSATIGGCKKADKAKAKASKGKKEMKKKLDQHKETCPLPPRKSIKQIIEKELAKEAPHIINEVMRELNQQSDPTNSDKIVWSRIECDGCGVHPIEGPRYKCVIC